MWQYRELYSCPLVIVLGVFKHKGLYGYATLAVNNYRVNILRKNNGDFRVVSNIGVKNWLEYSKTLCMYLIKGDFGELKPREVAVIKSMFYGGFGLYVAYKNNIDVLSLDYVKPVGLYFYIEPSVFIREAPEYRLDDLLILQYALRRGYIDVVEEAYFRVGHGSFILSTSHGDLWISLKPVKREGLIRIIPDNNPLRHVVRH